MDHNLWQPFGFSWIFIHTLWLKTVTLSSVTLGKYRKSLCEVETEGNSNGCSLVARCKRPFDYIFHGTSIDTSVSSSEVWTLQMDSRCQPPGSMAYIYRPLAQPVEQLLPMNFWHLRPSWKAELCAALTDSSHTRQYGSPFSTSVRCNHYDFETANLECRLQIEEKKLRISFRQPAELIVLSYGYFFLKQEWLLCPLLVFEKSEQGPQPTVHRFPFTQM